MSKKEYLIIKEGHFFVKNHREFVHDVIKVGQNKGIMPQGQVDDLWNLLQSIDVYLKTLESYFLTVEDHSNVEQIKG